MAQSDEASGNMAVLVDGELALVTYAGGLQFAGSLAWLHVDVEKPSASDVKSRRCAVR